jgi:hypothetical protein
MGNYNENDSYNGTDSKVFSNTAVTAGRENIYDAF